MIAAVTGPSVKIAATMCSQRMARSENDMGFLGGAGVAPRMSAELLESPRDPAYAGSRATLGYRFAGSLDAEPDGVTAFPRYFRANQAPTAKTTPTIRLPAARSGWCPVEWFTWPMKPGSEPAGSAR